MVAPKLDLPQLRQYPWQVRDQYVDQDQCHHGDHQQRSLSLIALLQLALLAPA